MTVDDEKKDKVLHTRVPESLESELRTRAERLGLSVSTLVRNILSNTFGLVEDIVIDSAAIARSARREGRGEAGEGGGAAQASAEGPRATSSAPAQPARIVGWQEVVLQVNAVCARTNEILPKGTRAAVSVTDPAGAPVTIISLAAMRQLTGGSADDRGDSTDGHA
jgi:plasmid stability protein